MPVVVEVLTEVEKELSAVREWAVRAVAPTQQAQAPSTQALVVAVPTEAQEVRVVRE
jgi:hypothetical protein